MIAPVVVLGIAAIVVLSIGIQMLIWHEILKERPPRSDTPRHRAD